MDDYPRILILMDTDRAYERGLVRGILKYSSLRGPFDFLRSESQSLGGLHKVNLKKIRQWKPDAVFWREGHAIRQVEQLGLPTIFFPVAAPDPRYSNVITDDADIGARGARHLLERGLEHFAFCGLSDEYYWSRGRKEGFSSVVAEAGYDLQTYDMLASPGRLEQWLLELPKPTGLMVCTDDCSIELFDAIRRSNLRIPEDIALVGVGNDEIICDFSSPPLSSVKLNLEEAGFRAAQMLDRMIQGAARKEDVVIETFDVIERQSSNFIAAKDELVAEALKYIYKHRSEPITVEDVVGAVPTSRRVLYRRFKQVLGRSIAKEIRIVRINHAAQMLLQTNFSIAEICEQLGFESASNFARTFLREKNTTPFKYRAKYSPFR
jgi:LacI family transcriptional regulator